MQFRISPAGDGWTWFTSDGNGGPASQGVAPDRATAAALVIRAIVRQTVGAPSGSSEAQRGRGLSPPGRG